MHIAVRCADGGTGLESEDEDEGLYRVPSSETEDAGSVGEYSEGRSSQGRTEAGAASWRRATLPPLRSLPFPPFLEDPTSLFYSTCSDMHGTGIDHPQWPMIDIETRKITSTIPMYN